MQLSISNFRWGPILVWSLWEDGFGHARELVIDVAGLFFDIVGDSFSHRLGVSLVVIVKCHCLPQGEALNDFVGGWV